MDGKDRATREAAWLRGEVVTRAVAGLTRPWLIARPGWPACALIPMGVRGWAREALFAWLILELERQRDAAPRDVTQPRTNEW